MTNTQLLFIVSCAGAYYLTGLLFRAIDSIEHPRKEA